MLCFKVILLFKKTITNLNLIRRDLNVFSELKTAKRYNITVSFLSLKKLLRYEKINKQRKINKLIIIFLKFRRKKIIFFTLNINF